MKIVEEQAVIGNEKIRLTPMNTSMVHKYLNQSVHSENSSLIVGQNLHSVYLNLTSPELKTVYDEADIVLIDGQPLRWLFNRGQRSRRLGTEFRIGSVDWLREFDRTTAIRRIAVVGASSDSNAETCKILADKTGAAVVGWDGLEWGAEREAVVLNEVRDFRPDLILLGLGMPLQEQVYLRIAAELPRGVTALVGGAIDQISGKQKRAPKMIGDLGLEWAWRLVLSPRRLGERYIVEPFRLAKLVLGKRSRG